MASALRELKSLSRNGDVGARRWSWGKECSWLDMILNFLLYARTDHSASDSRTEILDELDRAETEFWSGIERDSFGSKCHWSAEFFECFDLGLDIMSTLHFSFLSIAVVAGLVPYVSERISTQNSKSTANQDGLAVICNLRLFLWTCPFLA